MKPAQNDPHWVQVVDGQKLYPVKMLGPYETQRLADKARRGVLRLLIVGRYTAAVVSQQDLDGRTQPGDVTT